MIYVIAGNKGGTAKTTLAVNIAIYHSLRGKTCAFLDADPKPDGAEFFELRHEEHPEKPPVKIVRSRGDIELLVETLGEKYDCVVVDCGGYESDEMHEAIQIADKFVCPFAPTKLDLGTAKGIDKLIRRAKKDNKKLKSYAAIVKCPTHHLSPRKKDALEELKTFENFHVLSTVTKIREAWMSVFDAGCSIEEIADGKAKAEFQLMMQEIGDSDEA